MHKPLIALKYFSDDVNDNFELLKQNKLRVEELIENIQTWLLGQDFLELIIIYSCVIVLVVMIANQETSMIGK